ncbi:hypothetical protein GQ54DRAFT_68225 [Martensiomyces pterosporus]|nr:hypothetical protein GQ54DRAFT_68225 [Martensiomyces pterosporus]
MCSAGEQCVVLLKLLAVAAIQRFCFYNISTLSTEHTSPPACTRCLRCTCPLLQLVRLRACGGGIVGTRAQRRLASEPPSQARLSRYKRWGKIFRVGGWSGSLAATGACGQAGVPLRHFSLFPLFSRILHPLPLHFFSLSTALRNNSVCRRTRARYGKIHRQPRLCRKRQQPSCFCAASTSHSCRCA